MRPALKYNGAKWLLADWIIQHFPAHETYLDLFGGSAAVLIQKPLAKYEIYNDLDGEVVNFFRVLRESPKEFVRAIDRTPYAQAEFAAALDQLTLVERREAETINTRSKTEKEMWMQVYVTLCHLKVDLCRAFTASANPDEEWPEPALKPPRTRFDAMPGEITEEDVGCES